MKKLLTAAFIFMFALILAACDAGAQPVPTPLPTQSPSAAAQSPTTTALTSVSAPSDATVTSLPILETASPVPATSEPGLSATPEAMATSTNEPTIASLDAQTATPATAPPTAVEPLASPSETSPQGVVGPGSTPTTVGPTAGIGIDYPLEGSQVTFPLHVQARTGRFQSQVILKLKWQDGQQLSGTYDVIKDKAGNGWVVDSLDYAGESAPPNWPSQPATLQVLTTGGVLLASHKVQYLSDKDPNTQYVQAAFLLGDGPRLSYVHVLKTRQVAAAALNELLWGVGPRNFAGFTTSLPTPQEVIAYRNPGPNWGPRVTLRKVTIDNAGVATADFSREMMAYGGGSARVAAITSQITQTLKQFPTIKDVRILVDGKPNTLQP